MSNAEIGDRLRKMRERVGMSQRALGDATGIPQSTIHRIESGTRQAKIAELVLACGAVGATMAEVLGESYVREQMSCAARSTDSAATQTLMEPLVRYLEVAAYLDAQGIREVA